MRRRGLSLLEILIASGIMVAAMVPLWGLMGTSHKQVTLSADEIRVSQLAVEILEQIENKGWFPADGSYPVKAESGKLISIGNAIKVEVQVGSFPEYLDLDGKISVKRYPPAPRAETGKIMSLELNYKSKEQVGEEIKNYELSTFVSGN
ncbi:MAG: hypothetical protein GQF41_2700 [Candidatus Rifleibacterium amylolyticum]|nr:MAG: hypothetical protein GQF41_2700 [Candidatus Rifleibacterium amylolyticum]NLF97287.1 hypothetical protein [Candidatus Riflebacteria bacterium]